MTINEAIERIIENTQDIFNSLREYLTKEQKQYLMDNLALIADTLIPISQQKLSVIDGISEEIGNYKINGFKENNYKEENLTDSLSLMQENLKNVIFSIQSLNKYQKTYDFKDLSNLNQTYDSIIENINTILQGSGDDLRREMDRGNNRRDNARVSKSRNTRQDTEDGMGVQGLFNGDLERSNFAGALHDESSSGGTTKAIQLPTRMGTSDDKQENRQQQESTSESAEFRKIKDILGGMLRRGVSNSSSSNAGLSNQEWIYTRVSTILQELDSSQKIALNAFLSRLNEQQIKHFTLNTFINIKTDNTNFKILAFKDRINDIVDFFSNTKLEQITNTNQLECYTYNLLNAYANLLITCRDLKNNPNLLKENQEILNLMLEKGEVDDVNLKKLKKKI